MSKKKKDEGMNRKDSYVSLQNKNGFAKSTQPYSDIDMDKATKKSSP